MVLSSVICVSKVSFFSMLAVLPGPQNVTTVGSLDLVVHSNGGSPMADVIFASGYK